MQQVQNQLGFKINTPSDEDLKREFAKEQTVSKVFFDDMQHIQKPKKLTKSQRKHQRKNKKLMRRNKALSE